MKISSSETDIIINDKSIWSKTIDQPLIIAGPCSAESEKQVMSIAEELLQNKSINIFRAGIWKARTKPNTFEGLGLKALKWVKRVQDELKLAVTIEVMNAKQAQIAIDNDIKILWIGARTSVNPFITEEIAQVLKGTDVSVLIKNPLSPDLNLWLGAIERFYKVGIRNIAAIHRGFSTFYKTQYRNEPLWDIPIQLKCMIPSLPIICDPSHIAGDRTLIYDIAARAYKLGYDGLMIETHNEPEIALSDAKQQIKPEQLNKILEKLKYFKVANIAEQAADEDMIRLQDLRARIDSIDENILIALHNRIALVKDIDVIKNRNNMSALQPERWCQMLQERIQHGTDLGLSDELIKDIMNIIHQASLKIQK